MSTLNGHISVSVRKAEHVIYRTDGELAIRRCQVSSFYAYDSL